MALRTLRCGRYNRDGGLLSDPPRRPNNRQCFRSVHCLLDRQQLDALGSPNAFSGPGYITVSSGLLLSLVAAGTCVAFNPDILRCVHVPMLFPAVRPCRHSLSGLAARDLEFAERTTEFDDGPRFRDA